MIFTDTYINVPWGKLSVVCGGPKYDHPVVFLHGMCDTASGFMPLINRLPNGLRALIVELPGCGKSTPYLPGQVLHTYDYVEPLRIAVDHFSLKTFSFVGHSMGVQIGLLFNIIYPGRIDRLVSLDSLVYYPVEPHHLPLWYERTYKRFYDPNNYHKLTSTPDKGPLYTYEQAKQNVKKSRGLTDDAAYAVLQRALVPVDDKHYRFCYDQRMKNVTTPTFSVQYQLDLYGNMSIPHLIVFSSDSINRLIQQITPAVLGKYLRSNPKFRCDMLEGNHDVHINSPERVVSIVAPFLLGNDGGKERTAVVVQEIENAYRNRRDVVMSKL